MSEGDVVRKITISASGENIDSTTASVKSLGDATSKTTQAASGSKSSFIDLAAGIYVAKSAYEALSTASDGASDAFGRSTAAITAAIGAVLAYAPHKFGEIWQEGIDKLNSYVELSQKAGALSTDFYQRLTKGATDAKRPADEYLKVIENINKALDRQLGTNGNQNGSAFNTQVLELQKNGNLQGQTADVNRLNNSVTGPEQMKAALALITGALEAGEKLTAFKLSDTLFGPETTANLKNDNDALYRMQKSIEAVQGKDIVAQADIDRAVSMKTVLEDSQKIIDSWFTKAASDWSGLGIGIQQLWVNANQNFASVLTWLDKILGKTQEIANVKPADPEHSIWTKLGDNFTANGKNMPDGVSRMDDTDRLFGTAKQTLASQLGNSLNVTNAKTEAQKTDDFRTPDQSSPPPPPPDPKPIKEYNDAVDRAINSLTKHIEAQKADALAVGLGDGALAGFRVSASETAAVLANNGNETEKQSAKFAKLKIAAEEAADALAKAKVASEISRGQQTAFLSPEDVKIANDLKGIYGDDIPKALASSEAAAIRMNDTLKSIGDTARSSLASFGSSVVSGLEQGKSMMDALRSSASQLSQTLTNKAFTDLFNGNYIQAGIEAVAAIGTYIFGSSGDKDKAAREKNNEAIQSQVMQSNADAAARQLQDIRDQAAASLTGDPNSLAGQLQAFDQKAQQQRQDEAKAGNGAIVELEKSLAAQRLAIIEKSNEAITKTMEDFLNSIKTGSLSTLSQGDQLAYEQNLFNKQVSGAKGGNADDLSSLTQTASALLTLAQNFYASGTGYADVYKNVTDAITSIANNPNGGAYADAGVTGLTQDNNARWVNSGPNGALVATSDYQLGGMADGGIVGNGIYNRDSVMARYAGGGSIALAGGEHVTKATSVNASTRSSLDYINRTGKPPANDNAEVVRVLTEGFNGQTSAIVDAIDELSSRVKSLENTTRATNNQRRVPGTQKAS